MIELVPPATKRPAMPDLTEDQFNTVRLNMIELRKHYGVSQQWLAERLGLSKTAMSRLETGGVGNQRPTVAILRAYKEQFCVTSEQLRTNNLTTTLDPFTGWLPVDAGERLSPTEQELTSTAFADLNRCLADLEAGRKATYQAVQVLADVFETLAAGLPLIAGGPA